MSKLALKADDPANLNTIKFKMYTHYTAIREMVYREAQSMPPEETKDFDSFLKHFQCDILLDKQFEQFFNQYIGDVYYDLYMNGKEIPKDNYGKVSRLIERGVYPYSCYLARILKDKIQSLEDYDTQILYTINRVTKHLDFANVDNVAYSRICRNPDAIRSAFIFASAGCIISLIDSKQI